jgi:hypothetical protein
MATSLIDFVLSLFRDPVQAQGFCQDPTGALCDAGLSNVTPAQVQAVAATAVPHLALSGGDPVGSLQHAVASHHGMSPGVAAQPTFYSNPIAPGYNGPVAGGMGHNTADLVSHTGPAVLSPDAGHAVQQGGFNLGFGDIAVGSGNDTTLGNKTIAMGDGAVATGGDHAGDISNQIVSGDGSVLGDHSQAVSGDHAVVGDGNQVAQGDRAVAGDGNDVHSGDVTAGTGAIVSEGYGDIHNSGTAAGGDAIVGNHGPVFKDIDASGGSGGNAAGGNAAGGCDLFGGGANAAGGNAIGGSGGGGGFTYIDSHNVGGDQNNIDAGSGGISGDVNAQHADDNSVDNSIHDYSTHDSHDDNSEYIDNSTHTSYDVEGKLSLT